MFFLDINLRSKILLVKLINWNVRLLLPDSGIPGGIHNAKLFLASVHRRTIQEPGHQGLEFRVRTIPVM